MARNNDLVVTAGLNIEASVAQIEKDLKQVNDRLSADHALKIIANVDLSKTTQRIQSQLTTLSKNLSLNLGGLNINSSAINTEVSSVVSAIQKTLGSAANIQLHVDSQPINEFVERLEDVGIGNKIIDQLKSKLESLNVVITKIVPQFTQLKGEEQQLTSFSITGLDKAGNTIEYLEKFNAETGDFEKSSTKMVSNLVKIQQETKRVEDSAKAAQLAYNDFLKLKGQADVYSKQYAEEDSLKTQLTDIQKLIGEFDNTQPLEKQREGIINIDNALKLLKVDIDNIKKASTPVVTKGISDFYPNIAKGASTQDTISNAKNTLNELFAKTAGMEEDTANRVKRAVEDTTGALQRFYVQVERGDKSVETLTYALNEQGNAYEYLGKTIREADNSTDFRRKDITTQWDIQTQKLQQFITNAEKAGAASTVLSDDIANLKNKLNDKGDTSAMNSFLDDFDIAKAKFQAFNAEVRKDNAITNFNNKIKKLSADMNAYATTNQRAVESTKKMTSGTTFADEWVRLTGLMAKGANLTDTELRNLIADMAVFKKESKSAGLEGASAFERFANSFKVISTYISANQIINRVISQIREGITELKEINNILTEISKTSDRTSESLRRLGQSSFDVASNYGRTASDYLLGVQEMSRAGFGERESEALAELSLRAQAAGDMTAEMANEYIIATNAAYKLDGNIDKLNKVLDSQNYITNHNALNMENLAEATKLAASQAANAGVESDQLTAAIGTMVAVTQQGGAQAGRAFRGILMNLQQVKATATEIGDEGEDITSTSLSKYEKAVAALGVSMKQIKNGVISLRNPMEILRDLAAAVSKESKDSIKVANLLSSVGGKYRANQLSALLSNWDIYEKMLSEYNSVEAVGSAMDEAQKSANNWTGSLNQLKNSWTELVNNFVNSDEAVAVIQKLNDALQDLSSSETIKGLGVVTNKIVELVTKLDDYRNKVKGIPVLGEAYDFMSGLTNGTTFLKMANRISDWYNKDAREAEEAARKQEELNKAWSESTEIYKKDSDELNILTAEYVKLSAETGDIANVKDELLNIQKQLVDKYGDEAKGLNLVNGSIEEQINALIRLREEKNRQYIADNQESIDNAYKWFGIDADSADKLSSETHSAIKFDISEITSGQYDQAKAEADEYFNKIQAYIEDKYPELVNNIDFSRNGTSSIDTVLAATIKEGLTSTQIKESVDALTDAYTHILGGQNLQFFDTDSIVSAMQDWEDKAQSAYAVLKKIEDINKENVGLESLISSEKDYQKFINLQKESVKLSQELADSNVNVADRTQAGFDLRKVESELKELAIKYPEVADLINAELDSISVSFGDTSTNIELATEAWTESLEAAQKGVIANVDKIKSAMEKIYAGEGIDQKSAWEIINLDPDRLLSNIRVDESGKYKFDLQEIIRLKDEIISKEIEERKQSVAVAKVNRDSLEKTIAVQKRLLKGLDLSSGEYQSLKTQIEQNESTMNAYNYTIRNETLLIEYLNKATGNLVNTAEMLKASIEKLKKEVSELEKEAEGRYQAQLHVIDGIIDKHQKELDALEKEKDVLNEQLDALEKQKDSLEETIDNYRTVSNYVSETIEKQIEEVEDSRDEVEEYYDNLINKLKEENNERQAAIDKEEKLNALRNAQNNKVRYYDGARGWTYGVDQDALKKAQNDLDALEAEEKISKLEKEKEDALKPYEDRIKSLEEYAKAWKESLDFMTEAENERLTDEILGADWREKIKNQDYNTITTFQNQFRNYNTQLNTLVNTEIKKLQESVSAKDKEIKAKKEQIKVWQDYKATVQDAATTIKNKLEEYNKYLDSVTLNENSTNETRITNLQKFATTYEGIISKITAKNKEIEEATAKVDSLSNTLNGVQVLLNGTQNKLSWSGGQSGGMWNGSQSLGDKIASATGIVDRYSKQLDKINKSLDELLQDGIKLTWSGEAKMSGGMWNGSQFLTGEKHASGGLNTHTGYAWMDGTATKPELVLNNVDTAKLYNWIHTMSASQFKPNSSTTKTSNAMFNVQNLNVNGVQNPAEFTRELEKFMNRYWTGKLTESRLY